MTQITEEIGPAPLQAGPYPQFILFGDSITQWSASQERGFNFMPALQDAFIRRLDVINRGFSGYNTAQAVLALPSFMPKPDQAKVDFMIVFFGANDACLPGSPTGQHIPLDEYSRNLEAILRHREVAAHSPRLILVTPPPVNEYQLEFTDIAKGYTEASRTAEYTRKYASSCRDLGDRSGVPVLDLWSRMMAVTGWKEGEKLVGSKNAPRNAKLANLLVDGLHFMPPAYNILFEALMQLIKEQWPDQSPENVAFRLPAWTDAPKRPQSG